MEEEMAVTGSGHPRTLVHALAGQGRLARACVLAVAILAFNGLSTSASIGWCRSDPVLKIEDAVADVFVGIPSSAVPEVTGPTQFVITTPVGVSEAVLLTSPGFGYGETVTFQESKALKVNHKGIELDIAVFLPATNSTTPVLVEFAPRVIGILSPVSAEGTTNSWIYLETRL
jgi:hypothetical protein